VAGVKVIRSRKTVLRACKGAKIAEIIWWGSLLWWVEAGIF